jgi:hypothetical protein
LFVILGQAIYGLWFESHPGYSTITISASQAPAPHLRPG